jgi:hypothetical protein
LFIFWTSILLRPELVPSLIPVILIIQNEKLEQKWNEKLFSWNEFSTHSWFANP